MPTDLTCPLPPALRRWRQSPSYHVDVLLPPGTRTGRPPSHPSQAPAKDPRNKSRGLARSHSPAQRQQLRQTPNQKGVSAAKQREPTGGSKEGKARGQPVAGGEMRLCACAKRAELGAGVHDCKGMATEFSVEMIWRDGRIWVYTAGLYGGAEGQEGAYEESPRAQQHRFSGIGGQ